MLNTRIRLAAALLISSMTHALLADVIELEGTVTAVDAKERTITIKKKTLEIAKKCRITVDGEDADLDDLKPDQEVTVEYDDDLDVAKSISVGGSGADGDEVARALKELQGDWEAVGAEFGGKALDKMEVRRLNRFVKIKGNSFREERLNNGKIVGVEGKFEINPKTGAFDFIGKVFDTTKAFEYVGLYDLDGDTLKLCCRANEDGKAKRPKSFKSDDEKPNWSHYYIYKRAEE